MLCLKPIEVQTRFLPCGQCMNCRINKQRTWSSRIQLEALFHTQSIFVTLTYDEENVPKNTEGDDELKKSDLTKFIKKLRNSYSSQNSKFRLFACGEYGENTQRPHYHIILFGVGLDAEPLIKSKWKKGFHQISELTPDRCSYIAQYTIKKMNQPDSRGLFGRTPEYATMSTRPGIGHCAIPWLVHRANSAKQTIIDNGDVWNAIRISGKIWPIGNYLRRKLRERLGISHDAVERAVQFEHIDKSTGEILWEKPLPENYHPHYDIADFNTPWSNAYGKKQKVKDLPNITQAAAHQARSKNRRKTSAVQV